MKHDIKVFYEVRDSETDEVQSSFSKVFQTDTERYSWEIIQDGHPFLYLHVVNAQKG
jgi:hypothetical protein